MDESGIGWISYGPGGPGPELPEEVREDLLRRTSEREARRGRLLAVVQVYVWENGESDPQVSLPDGSPLSIEDGEQVADVVRLAGEALAGWR